MLQLLLGGSAAENNAAVPAHPRPGRKREKTCWCRNTTSSTEGRIYRELGDALSGMVESFFFTSLAEKILSPRAARRCRPSLTQAVPCWCAGRWRSCRTMSTIITATGAPFCQMAAQTIDELKSAGLSGQQLAQLAGACGAESAGSVSWPSSFSYRPRSVQRHGPL